MRLTLNLNMVETHHHINREIEIPFFEVMTFGGKVSLRHFITAWKIDQRSA